MHIIALVAQDIRGQLLDSPATSSAAASGLRAPSAGGAAPSVPSSPAPSAEEGAASGSFFLRRPVARFLRLTRKPPVSARLRRSYIPSTISVACFIRREDGTFIMT